MNLEDYKKRYGAEYPAAIVCEGMRVPLYDESRFTRSYRSDERNTTYTLSRFRDGSASITTRELERDWAAWTTVVQIVFCQQCHDLFDQSDFQEILHFVMKHGTSKHWSAIANTLAYHIPQQEAFDFLVQALQEAEIGHGSNITQGIALTKHPSVETVLRKHLGLIWNHPALWDDAKFLNRVAYDATNCIYRLIAVGASPADFAGQAQKLSQHVCSRNRDSWNRLLSKHYPEITSQN